MADPAGIAVGGIELLGPIDDVMQFVSQRSQVADGVFDVVDPRLQQIEHMAARCFTPLSHRDDAADLPQCQPERLGRPDEDEALQHVIVIVAIARRRATGGVEHTDVLVVAERFRGHARPPGDLADQHHLTFLCTGMLTVVGMQIHVLHIPDCANLELARARLREAIAGAGLSADVRDVEVATPAEAKRAGMRGSPTILIDGRDPFAVEAAEASLSCRLYQTADGVDGAPSVAQLLEALVAQ